MIAVFYTSSHGFGHAARDIEVINEIGHRRPDARIVVRSGVARWFFDASARVPAELQPIETDPGVVQIDSLNLDEDETAGRAARFYADFERRADAEATVLCGLNASIVVGDIPPLAFVAAGRAAVPSLALGNFTWDWIYEGYPQFERLAPGVIDVIRGAYARAGRALRLPLHGGFEPMRAVMRDIPLIARHSTLGRRGARHALGLKPDEIVVLASFGAYGLDLDYAALARRQPFRLLLGHDAPTAVRYEDLVAASDVVVSKPGYGIVSECIANGAALLYTSRGRFREHDMFVEEMPKVLRCRYIEQRDLLEGRWSGAIEGLLAQAEVPQPLSVDGAAIAAQAILEAASASSAPSASSDRI